MMMDTTAAVTSTFVDPTNTAASRLASNMDTNHHQQQQQAPLSDTTAAAAAGKAATTAMMIISTAEAMNPSKRNTMEDRHVILAPGTWGAPDPDMAFLAVCDGHGGRDMVNFLVHALPFHVANELNENTNNPGISKQLERAFLMSDLHAKQAGVLASGATVAICLVKYLVQQPPSCHRPRRVVQLTVANAGDSRVVLCHYDAPEVAASTSTCQHHPKVERLSIDHRPDDPQEVQRIEQAGGFCIKGRVLGMLAVSRSLGDQVLKPFVIGEPHVCEREVVLSHNNNDNDNNNNNNNSQQRSFIIVACDGLWDIMSDQEACDLVFAYKGDKTKVADVLVQEALRRGTTDNLTVVVAYL